MIRRLFLIGGLIGFSAILAAVLNQLGEHRYAIPFWAVALPVLALFLAAEYFTHRPSTKFTAVMGALGLGALILIPLVWYGAIETLAGKNDVKAPTPMGRHE